MHDARLDLLFGIDRFDRLDEAAQAVYNSAQNVLQAAVLEFIENLEPELGTLGLLASPDSPSVDSASLLWTGASS